MCGNKHCMAINSFTSTIFITTPVVYQNAIAGQMCPFFASGCSRKLKSFLYISVRNFAGLGDYYFCDALLKKAIFAFIVVDKSGDG